MAGKVFWVQIFQKPPKMAFYRHILASANGLKTNDVIEDSHHWRRSLAVISRAAYTIHSILGITAAVYFPVIKHYIQYPTFSLGKVYTACVGNLLYRVSHKMIPSSCFCWKTSKTSTRKRWTLREPLTAQT